MNHYLEIRILPDPEFNSTILMNALYAKLHRVLVSIQADNIGISFPEYRQKSLGGILRLHSERNSLGELMMRKWLKGMTDHIECSDVLAIPTNSQYCLAKRKQYKTNVERLRRRLMKRKGEGYSFAAEAIPIEAQQEPKLPYINLRSESTDQRFSLFIEQTIVSQAAPGAFNTYGLSLGGNVPWF